MKIHVYNVMVKYSFCKMNQVDFVSRHAVKGTSCKNRNKVRTAYVYHHAQRNVICTHPVCSRKSVTRNNVNKRLQTIDRICVDIWHLGITPYTCRKPKKQPRG